MFKNEIVDIPTKVKFNKRNQGIYVYHVSKTIYNKDKKYNVDKRELIGKKIDDKTMHPNAKYYELYGNKKEFIQTPVKEFSNTLSVGSITLLQNISDNISLTNILNDIFESPNTNMILNLACYHILENSTTYEHYPSFAFKHSVLGKTVYTDSCISNFLKEKINDSLIHNFFQKWIESRNIEGNIFISYDSTNINTESDGVIINEYGNAKDDTNKKIVNLSYVFDQKESTPLFYELYSGSINDMAECKKMLELSKEYGLNKAIFIADRGYFSKNNVETIINNFDGFIMMSKINNKQVLDVLEKNKNKVFEVINYIREYDVFGYKVKGTLYENQKVNYYIYFDDTRCLEDKKNITILAKTNYDEGQTYIGEKMDSNLKNLFPYCDFVLNEDNIVQSINFNDYLFKKSIEQKGYFVIISSLNESPLKILRHYRHRDEIEKCFRSLKTELGFSKLGVHSEGNLRSKIFIAFISSILRSFVAKSLAPLLLEKNRKDYTVNAALKNLSRIEATRIENEPHRVLYQLTKVQKEIITACGVKINDINKSYLNYE